MISKKKKKRSSPKFRVIFRPNSEIQRFFPPKIRWSLKKKKKGLHQNWDWYFVQFRKFRRLRGGCFRMGGLFSIFHWKSASKAQKTCDFAYFTSQWGGARAPPAPPWLRYWPRPRQLGQENKSSQRYTKLPHGKYLKYGNPKMQAIICSLVTKNYSCALLASTTI